jgi:hypothetical protein
MPINTEYISPVARYWRAMQGCDCLTESGGSDLITLGKGRITDGGKDE